jgi:phenylalanyl-tRNA synthetase beta chain
MNLSRHWLEAFLGRPLDSRELVDRLAMLGAPADDVVPVHAGLDDVIVGLVEEVRPHPHADRLWICLVNDGTAERRNVVCGASNVAAGHRYPFAPVGAALPSGLRIERRKLRGEPSEGMLCSARELGLGDDHEGILELEGVAAPGTRFAMTQALDDQRLVIDVTPNRPDLLGHKGVARELAASYGIPFRLPSLPGTSPSLPAIQRSGARGVTDGIQVAIEDPAGCGRFLGAVVRGVRVGPSPEWLRRRLVAVGLRPITSVVDATNYVMFELNQPLHAYDLARLRGGMIAARAARSGERVLTLDGQDRPLPAGAMVIADGSGVIGVAGVMGGKGTEVTDQTTDIFLECAWFSPPRTRATRKALGLSTEASYRFERGVDRWNAAEALRRCLEVILRVAGGTISAEPVDLWPDPGHPARIFLRRGRVTQVLGVELPMTAIEEALVAVGAPVVAKPDHDRLAVEVPGWRPDLVEEIDLVEEVARQYGYDRLPSELRPFRPGSVDDAPMILASDRVRRELAGQGLLEAVTLSLGVGEPEGAVRLMNPLSPDFSCLRRRLLPGLLREVERNWSQQVRDVRLFEIGTVFHPLPGSARPAEEVRVAAVVSGGRTPPHWTASGRAPDFDGWDLKALFGFAVALANPAAAVQVEDGGWLARRTDGTIVGRAGPLTADAPRWAGPVFGFEVTLASGPAPVLGYRPLPTTPASERDLALVVPDTIPAADVIRTVAAAAGVEREDSTVLDEYRGPGIPAGSRSLAIRLRFRSPGRTLQDREVDEAVKRIVRALERAHGITLRTA